jgi:hypothetical protein
LSEDDVWIYDADSLLEEDLAQVLEHDETGENSDEDFISLRAISQSEITDYEEHYEPESLFAASTFAEDDEQTATIFQVSSSEEFIKLDPKTSPYYPFPNRSTAMLFTWTQSTNQHIHSMQTL